jgi:hypothetical protein
VQTATQNGVTLASTTSSQEELNRVLQDTDSDKHPSNPEPSNQVSNQSSSAAGPNQEQQAESEPASDTGTPESEEEQPRARGKGGFQRRIDKLTREKTQALELAGQERLARLRLQAQLAGKAAGAPESRAAGDHDPKPTEEHFETWEDYTEALTRWAVRQEAKSEKQREIQADAEEAANERLRENFEAHNKRVNAARQQYEDWDQVAESLEGGGAIPQSVGLALVELENGPAVMYHLAKNPGLLTKLNEMSEVRAVAEVGRIAASLSSAETAVEGKSSPEPWPVSAAPAPIKPVGGSATKTATDPSKMPLADYIKWRNAGGGR